MAIIKRNEQTILKQDNMGELFNIAKEFPWTYDIDGLFEVAFYQLGSFPKKTINKMRDNHRRTVEKEVEQRKGKKQTM